MTSRLTLAQLRAFVAVADAGGFGSAAAELNMSQSSLSDGVQGLERVVGRPLFHRSAGGVRLTPAGERALAYARRAIEAANDVQAVIDDDDALTGSLNVATYRSLGVHVLPAVMAALHRQHPKLTVHLLDGESDGNGGYRLVEEGRADVGLLQLDRATPLLTWPLMTDEYFAVFPRSRGRHPVSWHEFQAQPLLMPSASDTCHANVRAHLDRHAGVAGALSEVPDDNVILSMVEHGLGVTVMADLAMRPLSPQLLALPLPVPLTRTLGVVVKPGRSGLPHIRALIESVRACMANIQANAADVPTP
ncbi:LysR family transcriptional regulator [Deinococcus sonorensis]|uniref:LysR family transcriptional regulator n=2 Tax=Deinococcus sonorensis TaxID=309891 RepID=A0AAU7U751_9DEIO